MNMVIFGILQPSTATLQLKKSQINGTERPMRKNLHELLSQSNVYTHCSVNPHEPKHCSTTHCSKSAGDTGIWMHMCMCINLNASILLG